MWTLFIVLMMQQPAPIMLPDDNGPTHVQVGPTVEKPNIDLSVTSQPTQHIDRMTGIETNTTINSPSAMTLRFTTQSLCEKAAEKLTKGHSVYNATCLETGAAP